jgi:spermidine synthase
VPSRRQRRLSAPSPARSGHGALELLADADRPGGWLLLIDRIRQSYVDLDDPTYLDFEYMQTFAAVLDALPPGPLAVTHVGGGACTFARYVAATRPDSSQLVLEPDAALIDMIRSRLPFPRGAHIRLRAVDGRTGITALGAASADLLVLDAFAGGRVPAELTTAEFLAEGARVLRAEGVLLANVADGPPLTYVRRLIATVRAHFPQAVVIADPGVVKARRFGNLVLAAGRAPLPTAEIRRAAAGAPFPHRVLAGAEVAGFVATAAPFTDAAPVRSPAPPEESWRVSE